MIDPKIAICVVASIVGHFVLGEALSLLPERAPYVAPTRVTVRVIEPPKPLEPLPPEPPPPPPEPTPPPVTPPPAPAKLVTKPTAKPTPAPPAEPPPVAPPVSAPAGGPATTTQPTFGVSMESTSPGGTGPAMPVGNTSAPGAPAQGKPAVAGSGSGRDPAAPVAAYEVTKMPLPRGRCAGKYTEAATAAATEGVVIIDLTVDASGRTRDLKVVEGLPNGLTEAAVAALEACMFAPGEREGVAVPVRVRGFKVSFYLDR